MVWRSSVILLVLGSVLACSTRERTNFGEEEFVTNEVRELKAALAARDETKVLVGCMIVDDNVARMPKAQAAEIEKLCYVDAPTLFLNNAVRDAIDKKLLGLRDVGCMQLLAGDAFKLLAKRPTTEPALQKLVDEYTRLCPEQVAKFRASTP